MDLKQIVKGGIVIAGSILAEEVIAENIKDWQIQPRKNEVVFHAQRGNTLGEAADAADRKFGIDDPYDFRRNLEWLTKQGYIVKTDCRNPIKNPNLIGAGEDYSFIGKALKAIDPKYGRELAEKNIQIITDKKVPKKWGRSLKSDISNLRSYNNKKADRIGKFVLNGGVGYSIFGEDIGEGMVIDLNAGYQVPGMTFTVGGRATQIDKDKYYSYRRSFFGFLHEAEVDEEYLTATELYAQLMFGNDFFKIGGGYGVKNIGDIEAGASYGYGEGEGGISRDYDRYTGGFGALQIMFPIDENFSAGISARHGEYKTSDGLKLGETSVGANISVKF